MIFAEGRKAESKEIMLWRNIKDAVVRQFAPPPPISSEAELLEFIDTRAAFVVQRCAFEYCRAKAGLHWDKLMQEDPFVEAIDRCRWEGYGACVSDWVVVLAPRLDGWSDDDLTAAVEAVLARHPVPPWRDDNWTREVEKTRVRLPAERGKPVHEVMRNTSDTLRKNMPVHQRLRIDDDEVIHAAVAFNTVRAVEDFDRRAVPEALARAAAEV